MCGRYATTTSMATLLERFDVADEYVDAPPEPDYNMAPTKSAPAVLCRPPRDAPEGTAPHRQIRLLRWGLVPFWADSPKVGARMINARAETVHERRAYRAAFKARRCILPADGFYEWFPTDELGRSGKPLKQPFYLHRADGDVLAFAGIYEFWRDPDRPTDDPHAWVVSFSILTTRANDDVGHIHDRMPMTIAEDNWTAWLDPALGDIDRIHSLIAPPPPGTLASYPVTTAVNNVRSNGPQLLQPLTA